MKIITEIDDDILFLSHAYEVAETASKCLKETGILDIRSRKPNFTGNETEEERTKMINDQAKKNLVDMCKRLMVEQPENAIQLFHALIVLDEGESYPKGAGLFNVMVKCLTDQMVVDFFLLLIRLGQSLSAI